MKITLLMALSLDGKIGLNDGHFPDWTAKGDKRLFAKLTKQAGVLVRGRKTYDTIGKPLPERHTMVMTRNKNLISDHSDLTYTGDTPAQIVADLADKYDEIIIAGGAQINTIWQQSGLITDIIVTINPVILGGGIGLFAEGISANFKLQKVETDDQLVILHYTPTA